VNTFIAYSCYVGKCLELLDIEMLLEVPSILVLIQVGTVHKDLSDLLAINNKSYKLSQQISTAFFTSECYFMEQETKTTI